MKRTFWRSSRVWSAVATLVVVAIALLPGTWSTAVAQTGGGEIAPTSVSTSTATSTTTVTSTTTSTATSTAAPTATSTTLPAAGGSVTVPNAGLTINFGQGALSTNTKVDFTPLVPAPTTTTTTPQQAQQTSTAAVQSLTSQNVPPPPGVGGTGGSLIQSLFTLDASSTTNGEKTNTFNAPVTLAIVVPPATLGLAGGNLANVQVFRFNETNRAWVQVACSASATGLSCSTSGFSIWALVVATPAGGQIAPAIGTDAGGATPVTPRPANTGTGVTPDSTSTLSMLAAILAAGSLLGAGAFAVQRRRS